MAKNKNLPEWEQVLAAASAFHSLFPEAVVVGVTATTLHAGHRISVDADHIINDLKSNYDKVLKKIEAEAGWKTNRLNRPVLILGSFDGIETGIRQLIRKEPLETMEINIRVKR